MIATLLILPLSFLFHLVVYENYWKQNTLERTFCGISLVVLSFLLLIFI
jgi:hypothetical protein